MDRAAAIGRLARLRLRPAADALREEIRHRHRADGKLRDDALERAWVEMWAHFEPVAEELERQKKAADVPDEPSPLRGMPEDVDAILDPGYNEADPGKWLRDGLLWVAAEIRRVLRDDADGPIIDLARARTPPPTAFAVFIAEHYARKAPGDRGELIARVMPLACKQHEPQQQGNTDGAEGGFLDTIG